MTAFGLLPTPTELKTDTTTSGTATGGPVNYVATLPYPPESYVDHMRISVRFPVGNTGPANLDVIGSAGTGLGSKPIRQVDGQALTPGHIAMNAAVILIYVGIGSGYWTLSAGARGAPGPPGPPDGTFSANSSRELIFSNLDGTPVANLGPIAPLYIGDYDAATAYRFLQIVKSGGLLYLHVGTEDTTGMAVTDTTVWQPIVDMSALPDATTTAKGLIELATDAEAETGTDTMRAMTPASTRTVIASPARANSPSGRFDVARLPEGIILNITTNSGETVGKLWAGTRTSFDALTPASDTLYFIDEAA